MSINISSPKTNIVRDILTAGNITIPAGYDEVILIIEPNNGYILPNGAVNNTAHLTSNRNIILPLTARNNASVRISMLNEVFEGVHSFRYAIVHNSIDMLYVDRRTSLELIYNNSTSKWQLKE
jgi:hypothetical protein